MRSIVSLFALLCLSAPLTAQTLQEMIIKTESENFETAAAGYRALLAKEPNRGDYYFHFGENYFRQDDLDSAQMMYSKGAELNATQPLNYIGLGKVLLAKNKINDAQAQFFKASSLGAGKNAEVFRRTGEAWLATENKNADEAIKNANAAIKLEPKNPDNHILLGDAQLEKNPTDGSGPIKSYKTATSLNPKSTKGILREGKLYQRGRNYQMALESYKTAISLDPNFAPAYRELAELYSMAGQPAKSIENWKIYLQHNNSDFARYRFMSALFSNKQYADAVAEYEALKQANFKNVYLERLAAYSYAEMNSKPDTAVYTKGLQAMDRFFSMAGKNFKYLPSDYMYKGLLLARTGKDSLGMIELEKAIALDTSIAANAYSNMASVASRNRNYKRVIQLLEKKAAGQYSRLNMNDCFDLGKAYYYSAAEQRKQAIALREDLKKRKKPETPELKTLDASIDSSYVKADSAFSRLTTLNPNWPWGYTWRGRANASLENDVNLDTAAFHYKKVLDMVKPEERTGTYKNNVIESLEFLGFYYVTKKDDATAKDVFTQLKEIDPGNPKVEAFFNPPKAKGPAPKPGGK